MAEQTASAKKVIDNSIAAITEQVMWETAADRETATRVAEEKVASVFSKVVYEVADKVQADTNIDAKAAYSLAKLITAKAVKEDRDPDAIIDHIESWAQNQSIKKVLLASVLEHISKQIQTETGSAAEDAIVQAQLLINKASTAVGQELTKIRLLETDKEGDVEVISTALFNLKTEELKILADMEEEAEKQQKNHNFEQSVQNYLSANMYAQFDECANQTKAYLKQIADMTFVINQMKDMDRLMAG